MSKMILDSAAEWYAACAAMIREGVTFKAYTKGTYYIIEFTGGY